MSAKVDLQLYGSMDHLRLVWQVGETLLESVPFVEDPEGSRYNVLLAVQEMVTNVLRHGYQLDEDQPVGIRMEASREGFGVTIRDQGPAFDPLQHYSPTDCDENEDATNLASGGYGILIARMVMDEVSYERDGDWNSLRMAKAAAVPVTPAGER